MYTYYYICKQLITYSFLLNYVCVMCGEEWNNSKRFESHVPHGPEIKIKVLSLPKQITAEKHYRDYLGQSSNMQWYSSLLQKISTISLPCLPAGQLDALTLKPPSLTCFLKCLLFMSSGFYPNFSYKEPSSFIKQLVSGLAYCISSCI